jgi:hypothetical protein
MLLDFGIVINAVLLVMGLLWCREMAGRWRSDLDEFRSTKDPGARHVLIVLWALTGVIVVLMLDFLVGILISVGVL